jgi:hypothetical protein
MKLSQLKLSAIKKPLIASEEHHRRSKMVRRLQEQIALARAMLSNAAYAPTRNRTVKDADGTRRVVSSAKRVKAWWFDTENNRLALTVRYGSQVLELGKGKFSVDVPDFNHLVPTLELIVEAVRSGELDTQIANAATSLRKGFKRWCTVNTGMKIAEIATIKPLTPQQTRVRSLKQNVQTAKIALQRERDRQQRERSAKRLQRIQQPKPV